MKLSALLSLMPTVRNVKAIALDVGAGKKAPTEFKIFGFGDVETSKGTFVFDAEAANDVMAAYRAQGNLLCMDYEHQMAINEDGGPMPAACYFGLELREDGLWAVNVEWSKQGKQRSKAMRVALSGMLTFDQIRYQQLGTGPVERS